MMLCQVKVGQREMYKKKNLKGRVSIIYGQYTFNHFIYVKDKTRSILT